MFTVVFKLRNGITAHEFRYETQLNILVGLTIDIAQHAAAASTCREWLESLEIDPELRAALVEQIRALEEAFGELMR